VSHLRSLALPAAFARRRIFFEAILGRSGHDIGDPILEVSSTLRNLIRRLLDAANTAQWEMIPAHFGRQLIPHRVGESQKRQPNQPLIIGVSLVEPLGILLSASQFQELERLCGECFRLSGVFHFGSPKRQWVLRYFPTQWFHSQLAAMLSTVSFTEQCGG